MSDHNRWTIDELITRYELEPKLKDVFVEGNYDQEILMNCYRSSGQKDRIVYEIDTVEVPDALVAHHGLTSGKKQRVIVLARELASKIVDSSYRCIVDRDLDHWFGSLETTARLVWMEYCSIELYFFTNDVIENLLIHTAKSKITNLGEYIESLIRVLSVLYALRLADRELESSLSWLSIDRCLCRDGNKIEFKLDEYLKRVLLSNNKLGIKDNFLASLAKWQATINGDPKYYIRGHDFVAALAWTVKSFKGIREFSDEPMIERTFVLLAPNVTALNSFLKLEI